MMYRMPTLPNSSKLASFDRMLSPWGPKSVPAKINPMICGILNLLRIGAHKIITMTNKNMAIGSVKGKVGIKSSIYFISAKLVIFFKLSNSVKVMLNVLFFCGFVKKYYYILMELLIKNFISLKLAYGFLCIIDIVLN